MKPTKPAKQFRKKSQSSSRHVRVAIFGTVVLALLGGLGFALFRMGSRDDDPTKVTRENYDRVGMHMDSVQVRRMLGSGRSGSASEMRAKTQGYDVSYWEKWKVGDIVVLVGYNDDKRVMYKQWRQGEEGVYQGEMSRSTGTPVSHLKQEATYKIGKTIDGEFFADGTVKEGTRTVKSLE